MFTLCILLKKARSPIYPYPYQPTIAVPSIDRPLMTVPNVSYAQRQTAMSCSPLPMQHSNSPTFPTNLSTNNETALAHVRYL